MLNPRKTIALMSLLASALLFASAPLFAQDDGQNQGDPPARVARIAYAQGDVSFMATGTSQWTAAAPNYPMTSGDRLYADSASRVEIQSGSTNVRLWELTDATLTNLTDTYEQIGLAQGSIRVRIYGLNPGSTVEVDTPNGSAVITQPGDYRVDTFTGDGGSDVVVNAGALQITGPNGLNQEVDAGQAVQMTGTDQVALTPLNPPAFDALDQWSIDRDHQILNSQSAQYVSPDTPGYSDLDANGSWTPTPDYGPVWFPSSVSADWRPYSAGHWAYVAPWGYTWIDDAPWGYAPFHYGRWAQVGGRWGWCPGPRTVVPVYSPALVAFVGGGGIGVSIGIGGGGGGVAAWFPLGVGEPFVPWYHASPAYARQVNVTNVNITNIHNTTIVNNYNSYITSTRTVNNVSQLNTANVQYANRAQVTAVPANAMSSGRSVIQTAVKLTPQARQQFAAAPVRATPSVAAPARPLLAVKTNVKAPSAAPTLMTTRGLAKATPAANPARLGPVSLPKPQPASSMPRPAAGAVAGRPATAQPPAAAKTTVRPTAPAGRPATPVAVTPARPAAPLAGQPGRPPSPAVQQAPTPARTVEPSTTAPARSTPPATLTPERVQPSPRQPSARPAAPPPGRTNPPPPAHPAPPSKPAPKPAPKKTPPPKEEPK